MQEFKINNLIALRNRKQYWTNQFSEYANSVISSLRLNGVLLDPDCIIKEANFDKRGGYYLFSIVVANNETTTSRHIVYDKPFHSINKLKSYVNGYNEAIRNINRF